MTAIPARDLRNHPAEVLRRVEAGEEIEVLRDNRPVAKIVPLSQRRQWLPAAEIGHELVRLGPDTTGLASRRLPAYQLAQRFEALTVDEAVSEAWALLVSRLRAAGRRAPVNDSWIAATAIAHGVPVVTQDSDYEAMPDVRVIRI